MKTYLSIQYAEKYSKGSMKNTSSHCFPLHDGLLQMKVSSGFQALNHLTIDGVFQYGKMMLGDCKNLTLCSFSSTERTHKMAILTTLRLSQSTVLKATFSNQNICDYGPQ